MQAQHGLEGPALAVCGARFLPIQDRQDQIGAREEFDQIFRQVERWGLDQYAKERAYENLVYSAGS